MYKLWSRAHWNGRGLTSMGLEPKGRYMESFDEQRLFCCTIARQHLSVNSKSRSQGSLTFIDFADKSIKCILPPNL